MAWGFGIKQLSGDVEKIRRGDDEKHSLMNEAAVVDSKPTHHTVDTHVDNIRYGVWEGLPPPRLWSHDQESAFRFLPSRDPTKLYVVIQTEKGPVIFQHYVLNFGARASVWAYNRFADALRIVVRLRWFILTGHYVDDFNGEDPPGSADSSFDAVARLGALLGWPFSKKKEQPPSSKVVRLGTCWSIIADALLISPKPTRVKKLIREFKHAVHVNLLPPVHSGTLAGKSTFVCQGAFGKVGRACVKALYARQHSKSSDWSLVPSLRMSITALSHLLGDLKPRTVPQSRRMFAPRGSLPTPSSRWAIGGSKLPTGIVSISLRPKTSPCLRTALASLSSPLMAAPGSSTFGCPRSC